MKFQVLETTYNGRKFRIEEDHSEIGSYLYVYDEGNCIKDYLQNDIATCKQVTFEDYGVPLNKWEVKEEGN